MEMMKALRLLGDESRVRILRLLSEEDLSVADLQEILGMGQSRISMQLSQLKQAGLVDVRRSGQRSIYRSLIPASDELIGGLVQRASTEIAETRHDDEGLRLVLARRKDDLRSHFDALAGRFGRDYVPGRSWKALSESMLKLLPPLTIADLGAGEGTLSLMLAQRAVKVIAVDSSEKMVEYGAGLATRNGVENLDYRRGDLEDLPIDDCSIDLVLMHQTLHHAPHPQKAVGEAFRVLKPTGRILILDLLKHDFDAARELYADVWLGFSQVELMQLLREAGFEDIDVGVADREVDAPYFETTVALARKPMGIGTSV